ncbi:hypothetical protein KP509_19G071900 [Ceratopteris richardii]|uniref:AAA+ ATPase domain-containing protein n=1 Tax=Ceratopteris richardii TaxID=49495 RepID=A0A8T2SLB4_CERRI|nr:hypothetical protein KP509_19G071900 [Ceratopteris richardii]
MVIIDHTHVYRHITSSLLFLRSLCIHHSVSCPTLLFLVSLFTVSSYLTLDESPFPNFLSAMEVLMSKLFNLMGVFALVQTLIPPPLRQFIDRGLTMLCERLFPSVNPYPYMEIQVGQNVPDNHSPNELYKQVGVYVGSLRSALHTHDRLRAYRCAAAEPISLNLQDNASIEDSFDGVQVFWTKAVTEKGNEGNNGGSTERSFILRFLKTDRENIVPAYLDHVSKVCADIEHKNSRRSIFTNSHGNWEKNSFNHPSTFDSLALEAGVAERRMADLQAFSKGKSFYHRNGRAWKRGYLLYGPPGTGKSSLIAAIANYMQYDIYDLELTKVYDNTSLKSLLVRTSPKSVIVIEDIDCSVKLSNRDAETDDDSKKGRDSNSSSKFTLSGLLNFVDGLWSCCGEERIFIFTTNFKERIDSALLRPGRMDMHILLSYCSFHAFKKLARNYLSIQDHPMFPELEKIMTKTSFQVTPAAIAEMLISNQDNPDAAISEVLAAFSRHVDTTIVIESASQSMKKQEPQSTHTQTCRREDGGN